jgi:CspA family cold shock protein
VKWFSPEKGFGFVVLEDGSGDAFLHAGVVERSGYDPADLPSGTSLQISSGTKGDFALARSFYFIKPISPVFQ